MYHLPASCSIFPRSYRPQGLFSPSQWEFEPNTYSNRPPGGAQYSCFTAPFILFMHQSLRLYSSLHFRLFFFFFSAVKPGRQSEIWAAWYDLLKGHVPINCITKRETKKKAGFPAQWKIGNCHLKSIRLWFGFKCGWWDIVQIKLVSVWFDVT